MPNIMKIRQYFLKLQLKMSGMFLRHTVFQFHCWIWLCGFPTVAIGCQLLLITNKKSHMGFRFVPIPMTLNDLEPRNSPYFAFSPNSIVLFADNVTVVEDRPIMSVKYCLPVPDFYLAKTITHPAARSLCDSWTSCTTWSIWLRNAYTGQFLETFWGFWSPIDFQKYARKAETLVLR